MTDGGGRLERLAEAASLVSNKWHPAIVGVLAEDGATGFNDLKERLGSVSAKVLSDSLEALGEADLVERRVLTESPLRVEYALTGRGEDMVPVVESLEAWADAHLVEAEPTVLVADDDPRIARMHADWVAERYDVRVATGGQEALERSDESVDLAVLDRGLAPGDLPGRLRERDDCLVLSLTSSEPGPEVATIACDEYLVKPTDRETLLGTVERVLDRVDHDTTLREYLALRSRRRAIVAATTERRRADSDAFADLEARLATLSNRLDDDRIAAALENEPGDAAAVGGDGP
jgi:DNA-binding HxlR family transcriptional regulator